MDTTNPFFCKAKSAKTKEVVTEILRQYGDGVQINSDDSDEVVEQKTMYALISSIVFRNDSIFDAVLAVLGIDGDTYVKRCLEEKAPLFFPKALSIFQEKFDRFDRCGRLYWYTEEMPSSPVVEIYDQGAADGSSENVSTYVSSLVGHEAVQRKPDEDIFLYEGRVYSIARDMLRDAYVAAGISDVEPEELGQFLHMPLEKMPVSLVSVCEGEAWFLLKDGVVEDVVQKESDNLDDPGVEVYPINSVYCALSQEEASQYAQKMGATAPVSDSISPVLGFCEHFSA